MPIANNIISFKNFNDATERNNVDQYIIKFSNEESALDFEHRLFEINFCRVKSVHSIRHGYKAEYNSLSGDNCYLVINPSNKMFTRFNEIERYRFDLKNPFQESYFNNFSFNFVMVEKQKKEYEIDTVET